MVLVVRCKLLAAKRLGSSPSSSAAAGVARRILQQHLSILKLNSTAEGAPVLPHNMSGTYVLSTPSTVNSLASLCYSSTINRKELDLKVKKLKIYGFIDIKSCLHGVYSSVLNATNGCWCVKNCDHRAAKGLVSTVFKSSVAKLLISSFRRIP